MSSPQISLNQTFLFGCRTSTSTRTKTVLIKYQCFTSVCFKSTTKIGCGCNLPSLSLRKELHLKQLAKSSYGPSVFTQTLNKFGMNTFGLSSCTALKYSSDIKSSRTAMLKGSFNSILIYLMFDVLLNLTVN